MGAWWSEPDADHVSISNPRSSVEAGERVILRTVEIKMHRKNEPASAPRCIALNADYILNDKVECKEQEPPGPEAKLYHILYYAEKTGRRTLQICFGDRNVEIERGSRTIQIDVLPSSPCSLKLQSIEENQNTRSVYYPNEEVEFYVVPYDKFGNIYDRGNLKMQLKEDDSIKLITSKAVNNKGLYSVKVQCLEVGQIKCMISFQGITTPLVFSFEVRDVPVSSKPSRINKEELEDEYDGSQASHSSTGDPYTGACITRYGSVLRLKGCRAGYAIGPDHTRLNNINRALGFEAITDSDIEDLSSDRCREEKCALDIDLHRLRNEDEVCKVENLLDSLLEARHYRRLAGEVNKERVHWKEKATSAYDSKMRHEAKMCSGTKKEFGARMNEYNLRACDAIFAFYNENRSQSEIDLHELYVSDEDELKDLKRQMGERRASEEIARIRDDRDEAIRKLQGRLNTFDHDKAISDGTPWLEIIVGAGKHSHDNRQKIRPRVEKFLRNQDLPVHQLLRKGSLLITFREYTGQQPCFGHFYCERCDNSWRSRSSWVGKYQCCNKCFEESNLKEKCYPMMLQKRKQSSTTKATPQKSSYMPKHREIQELCERCCELGRCCSNA